jgi:hypothetical protein
MPARRPQRPDHGCRLGRQPRPRHSRL